MSCNWAGNLDMLAQNGVIDFDAASYIMGQPLRYVGNPTNPSPFNGQPPTMTNLNQPKIDEFKINNQQNQGGQPSSIPTWKKVAFGALAIGGLAFFGYKFKSISSWCKNQFNKLRSGNISFKSTKKFFKDIGTSIGNFFSTGWKKFTGLFHKKKP